MKSTCPICGQTYRGVPLTTVKDGQTIEACPACYKTLDTAYRKNSCIACVFFHSGTCELFGTELEEPYIQNLKCGFFTTSTDEATISKAKIKKYEMAGRFEEAAKEYEKIGMKDKAEETLRKAKETPKQVFTLKEALDQLNQRGQILTYYCCHCGATLKLDPMRDVLNSCPNCKYDLSAIDIAKLINQHL